MNIKEFEDYENEIVKRHIHIHKEQEQEQLLEHDFLIQKIQKN